MYQGRLTKQAYQPNTITSTKNVLPHREVWALRSFFGKKPPKNRVAFEVNAISPLQQKKTQHDASSYSHTQLPKGSDLPLKPNLNSQQIGQTIGDTPTWDSISTQRQSTNWQLIVSLLTTIRLLERRCTLETVESTPTSSQLFLTGQKSCGWEQYNDTYLGSASGSDITHLWQLYHLSFLKIEKENLRQWESGNRNEHGASVQGWSEVNNVLARGDGVPNSEKNLKGDGFAGQSGLCWQRVWHNEGAFLEWDEKHRWTISEFKDWYTHSKRVLHWTKLSTGAVRWYQSICRWTLLSRIYFMGGLAEPRRTTIHWL